MVVSIAAYKFLDAPFPFLAGGFAVSLLGLLVLGAIGLIGFLMSLFKGDASAMKSAGLSIVVGALPLVAMVILVGDGFNSPRIHDVSTDLDDVPVFIEVPKQRVNSDNNLAVDPDTLEQQSLGYSDLAPLQLDVSVGVAYDHVREAVSTLGWEVLRDDVDSGELEAVDESAVFGFKDDVIVRVRPAPDGSRIDARSASRVGEGDLGANAKRIHRLFEAIEELR